MGIAARLGPRVPASSSVVADYPIPPKPRAPPPVAKATRGAATGRTQPPARGSNPRVAASAANQPRRPKDSYVPSYENGLSSKRAADNVELRITVVNDLDLEERRFNVENDMDQLEPHSESNAEPEVSFIPSPEPPRIPANVLRGASPSFASYRSPRHETNSDNDYDDYDAPRNAPVISQGMQMRRKEAAAPVANYEVDRRARGGSRSPRYETKSNRDEEFAPVPKGRMRSRSRDRRPRYSTSPEMAARRRSRSPEQRRRSRSPPPARYDYSPERPRAYSPRPRSPVRVDERGRARPAQDRRGEARDYPPRRTRDRDERGWQPERPKSHARFTSVAKLRRQAAETGDERARVDSIRARTRDTRPTVDSDEMDAEPEFYRGPGFDAQQARQAQQQALVKPIKQTVTMRLDSPKPAQKQGQLPKQAPQQLKQAQQAPVSKQPAPQQQSKAQAQAQQKQPAQSAPKQQPAPQPPQKQPAQPAQKQQQPKGQSPKPAQSNKRPAPSEPEPPSKKPKAASLVIDGPLPKSKKNWADPGSPVDPSPQTADKKGADVGKGALASDGKALPKSTKDWGIRTLASASAPAPGTVLSSGVKFGAPIPVVADKRTGLKAIPQAQGENVDWEVPKTPVETAVHVKEGPARQKRKTLDRGMARASVVEPVVAAVVEQTAVVDSEQASVEQVAANSVEVKQSMTDAIVEAVLGRTVDAAVEHAGAMEVVEEQVPATEVPPIDKQPSDEAVSMLVESTSMLQDEAANPPSAVPEPEVKDVEMAEQPIARNQDANDAVEQPTSFQTAPEQPQAEAGSPSRPQQHPPLQGPPRGYPILEEEPVFFHTRHVLPEPDFVGIEEEEGVTSPVRMTPEMVPRRLESPPQVHVQAPQQSIPAQEPTPPSAANSDAQPSQSPVETPTSAASPTVLTEALIRSFLAHEPRGVPFSAFAEFLEPFFKANPAANYTLLEAMNGTVWKKVEGEVVVLVPKKDDLMEYLRSGKFLGAGGSGSSSGSGSSPALTGAKEESPVSAEPEREESPART